MDLLVRILLHSRLTGKQREWLLSCVSLLYLGDRFSQYCAHKITYAFINEACGLTQYAAWRE